MKVLLAGLIILALGVEHSSLGQDLACGNQGDKYSAKVVKSGPLGLPPAGEALIVMIETEDQTSLTCPHGCETVRMGLDGKWEGATRGNSYLAFTATPGEHHLCSNWQAMKFFQGKHIELAGFTAEPGKTYFFRTHVVSATPESVPVFTFDSVNADEGRMLVETLPVSESRLK